MIKLNYKKIQENWKSGITVSMISVPLALALAITSGATPTQGIITAFWAGLLGAIFGGSHFNVIGPTGALAGILISYSLSHGYETLPLIAILSGIIIMFAYFFHLDKYIIFIPKSVVHGFTLGVAMIIGVGQLDNILGINDIEKSEHFIVNIINILQNIEKAHYGIFVLFIISTVFIIIWNKKFPKIPGGAIIVFFSIVIMMLLPAMGYTPSLVTLADKYPNIQATLFENTLFHFNWSIIASKEVWTLAIINALFIAIITFFILGYFKLLPMVIIASMLVVVAIGMVEKRHFIHLIENEKIAFFLSILVAILVVVEDPIFGILVGTVIALLLFINKLAYGQTEVLLWKNGKMTEVLLKNDFLKKEVIDSDIVVYKISGSLTYVNMPAHLEAVQKIQNNNYVIISLRHSFYADIDGIDYLSEIVELLKKNKNKKILLTGINKEIEKLIYKEPFYKNKVIEGKIYKRTSDAINKILN